MTAIRFFIFCLFFALARPVLADSQAAQDVFVGAGAAGPFSLSWRGIAPLTETVQINGVPQVRGLDYSLDATAGTLTLSRPLPVHSAAQVRYVYETAVAVRNSSGLSVPLALDLARGDRFNLSLNAIARQNGPLTLAVGSGWRGENNATLSAKISFAPALNATDTASAPNGLERMTLNVAGATDAGRTAKLTFGYARAGVGAGTVAGDSGTGVGTQKLTFGGQFAPSKQFQAAVGYAQTDKIDGAAGGASAQTTLAMTLTPSAALQVQTNLAQSAAQNGDTNISSVNLSAKPAQSVNLTAAYNATNAPGAAGDTQNFNLTTAVTPSKIVALSASAGQAKAGEVTTNQQGASVTVNPRATLQLSTDISLRQTDRANWTATRIGASARPFTFLEVSGSYRTRAASGFGLTAMDMLETGVARVALAPVKTLKFVGTYAQNPDDGGTPTALTRQGVGVETSLGALSLSGGYDWSQAIHAPDISTSLRANLGLRFSSSTSLVGGYTQTLTGVGLSPVGTSAFSLGFRRTLGDRFNFALSGTLQKPVGSTVSVPADYNTSANLGVKF